MNWLLVAMGGAIGATLRYGAGMLIAKPQMLFPWPTWWTNIIGCLCAGIFFALSQKYSFLQTEARLFLMVGILGGFTTFSSFGLETFQLLKQGAVTIALSYVISSVIVGVLMLGVGFYLTQLALAQA
ncbi:MULTISPECIES: fluoride efflux transporter CrcB [Acinetobacter]|uniref:fluoride efflux transporter CrcB n=1 Tax=Acinetobacter TaxID=469 RepID=UPI001409F78D|nr:MULTISPECIES: fluoride efflux transporter CrcB [Acinetobacter]NHB66367.1 fluoride efflux transporter CrcB [Acinetobacter sp. GFQ9D191M]NHB99705.1 fluoride efflux transporter CrcB [Acinetobacter sp. GFQ9D192M]WKT73659.1 fluoride efflux transporter CrcB [Acinetobacter variabilis]